MVTAYRAPARPRADAKLQFANFHQFHTTAIDADHPAMRDNRDEKGLSIEFQIHSPTSDCASLFEMIRKPPDLPSGCHFLSCYSIPASTKVLFCLALISVGYSENSLRQPD
jgi:hypothetical protein